MKYAPYAEHVMEIFILSTRDEKQAGMAWYNTAQDIAKEISGGDISRGAGVLAAMSPMTRWPQNVKNAKRIFAGETHGISLPTSERKAIAILNGADPISTLNGDKTVAFYSNIVDTENPLGYCTIDRHAHDIAVGARLSNNHPSRNMTGKRYKDFVSCYQECAITLGIGAPQLQAITWVSWRNKFGIFD